MFAPSRENSGLRTQPAGSSPPAIAAAGLPTPEGQRGACPISTRFIGVMASGTDGALTLVRSEDTSAVEESDDARVTHEDSHAEEDN